MTEPTGQEPTPSPTPGASSSTPTAETSPATGSPSASTPVPTADNTTLFSREYVEQLRSEAAGYRTRLKTAEEKVTEFERSQLSEQERLKTDLAAAQTAHQTLQQRIQELEVQVASTKHGIVDPEAASKLLDWEAVKGGMTIDDALQALVTNKPYLKAPAATPPPAPPVPPATTSAAAPAREQQPPLYTRSEIEKNGTLWYAENHEKVEQAIKDGRVDWTR